MDKLVILTDAHLACFSKLVYAPWSVVREVVNARGGENYRQWDVEGTQAFLATFPQSVVVAFAGTSEAVDVCTDLDATLVRHVWGRVHRGFARAADYVAGSVIEAARKLRHNGTRLVFTGHSLGGAVATLVAAAWRMRVIGTCECVTFGSPRVGDVHFAERFDSEPVECRRYVNNNDIVAHLPAWLHSYRHVGQFRYITNGGGVLESPSLWQRLKWGLRGVWDHVGRRGLDAVEDHRVQRYVDALGGG